MSIFVLSEGNASVQEECCWMKSNEDSACVFKKCCEKYKKKGKHCKKCPKK